MQEDGWLSRGRALAARMVEASCDAPIWLKSSLVSGLTFGFGLPVWQFAGKAFKVSCATPLGTVVGFVAVAATVETAVAFNALLAQPAFSFTNFHEWLYREENVVQAVVGLVAFKMLGGKFRNLMPSDVRYTGALARVSIPARAPYANDVQKAIINDLFKEFGCHHCGKRTGESISDHMPPNVTVHGPRKLLINSKRLQKTDEAATQRFYPQCRDCIKLQSTALRHRGPSLVLHWKRGWPQQPFYYAGFFLGSAHLYDSKTSRQEEELSALHLFPHEQSIHVVRKSLEKLGPARLQSIREDIERLRCRDKEIESEIRTILRENSILRLGTWTFVRAGSEEQPALTELTAELERNAKLKGELKEDMRWLQGQLRRP